MAALPLDHPYAGRPHRVYLTLTNHCNRNCPWCSVYAGPKGNTWLTVEQAVAVLPRQETFEIQLEGGEPTLHPQLIDFANLARDEGCRLLVLSTNGTLLPRDPAELAAWYATFPPMVIKLSINHYLLARDKGLFSLACLLVKLCGKNLVLNVRLRQGGADDPIVQQVTDQGLLPWANVFYLQRYGRASGNPLWQPPYLAGTHFSLINPDGQNHGTDLLARSQAMRHLR